MFEKSYKPNKLRNKAVEEICRDFHYTMQYYQSKDLIFYDQSNTHSLKFDIQDTIAIYLNDDQTADIITYGPGLQRSIPIREVIQICLTLSSETSIM